MIDLIGNNMRMEYLNSLLEASEELVELAQEAKEASLCVHGEVSTLEEAWDENVEFEEDGPVMEGIRKNNFQVGQEKIGIHQKEVENISLDCGENKRRGRIPNSKKLKLDGESNGHKTNY